MYSIHLPALALADLYMLAVHTYMLHVSATSVSHTVCSQLKPRLVTLFLHAYTFPTFYAFPRCGPPTSLPMCQYSNDLSLSASFFVISVCSGLPTHYHTEVPSTSLLLPPYCTYLFINGLGSCLSGELEILLSPPQPRAGLSVLVVTLRACGCRRGQQQCSPVYPEEVRKQ